MRAATDSLGRYLVVVTDESPTDAAIVDDYLDQPTLILRKTQSFSNAVAHVAALFPGEHIDDVRAFIREAMPNAADFDSIPGTSSIPPRWIQPAAATPKRARIPRKVIFALVAATIAAVPTLAYFVARSPAVQANMFSGPNFQTIISSLGLTCAPLTNDSARCSEPDRGVVSVRAMRRDSQDHAWFTFYEGTDVSVIIAFDTVEEAREWATQPANLKLYGDQSMTLHGRFVTFSTDPRSAADLAAAVRPLSPTPYRPRSRR